MRSSPTVSCVSISKHGGTHGTEQTLICLSMTYKGDSTSVHAVMVQASGFIFLIRFVGENIETASCLLICHDHNTYVGLPMQFYRANRTNI